jgi:hypothetical protein
VDVFDDNNVAHGSPADQGDDAPLTPDQPPAVAPECIWFTFPFSRATITFVKRCGGRWCNLSRAWYFRQTEFSSARGLAAILARCDRLPAAPAVSTTPQRNASLACTHPCYGCDDVTVPHAVPPARGTRGFALRRRAGAAPLFLLSLFTRAVPTDAFQVYIKFGIFLPRAAGLAGTFMGYDFVFSTWAFSAYASWILGIAAAMTVNVVIVVLTIWMLDLISSGVHLLLFHLCRCSLPLLRVHCMRAATVDTLDDLCCPVRWVLFSLLEYLPSWHRSLCFASG